MRQKSKVVIVGAGVPGLILSLMLAEQGISVTLIEKFALPDPSDIKPSGRTAAFMQGSIKLLQKVKIFDDVTSFATPLKCLSIIDDSRYPKGQEQMVRQDFHANEIGLDQFGYNIPLGILTAQLAQKAKSHPQITVRENTEFEYDKTVSAADLVIGADGRHSAVRKYAGIDVRIKNYDQTAITCLISHSQDHNFTSVEFHRNGGPCTFVPCGNKQSTVVWVEKSDNAQKFTALSKAEFIHALQQHSRNILGRIDLIAGPETMSIISMKPQCLIAPKTVLIAEAAHVLSPIGAQGLNLSLRDVDVLSSMIAEAMETGTDIGSKSFLDAYKKKRMTDIGKRQIGVDLLNDAVQSRHPVVTGLRRLGLKSLGLGGPVRHFLMQEGLSPKS